MTERISAEEAHELWSQQQLELFREMGTRERLNALKTGALENWTEATRDAAFDLLGDLEIKPVSASSQKTSSFEPARHPLPLLILRSTRTDRFVITAVGGWTAVMLATAAHAFGLLY